MSDCRLIVNADDFGRSAAINRGVLLAHTEGIVTSASLMVRYEAGAQAALAARDHPRLGLGLHLDLAEWEYRGGEWRPLYQVVDPDVRHAVHAEVETQFDRFRRLVGRDPTHIDSHQHVHHDEPVRSVAAEMADALGVPLRRDGSVRYCGAFYGQDRHGAPAHEAIGPESLAALVRGLPEGATELCCHPADATDVPSAYAAERILELRALCHPTPRRAIEERGAALCNFEDVTALDTGAT
ncbi:MAG: ChbG/HpnK family deacetylase [Actinomycetota bacterium]|nr:ChbG/HpnK family deacetylase [Actinomycetota bacterium]MDQ3721207.1 ChbG/HpnK family deacetylase [Actinomycetota bacterium]